MPSSTWTPLQELAITLRGCDILVSAAAGAGKTSVLVERVIRQVLDPVNPLDLGRLLAVTFTEKAAAEMKQRIRASLDEAGRMTSVRATVRVESSVKDTAGLAGFVSEDGYGRAGESGSQGEPARQDRIEQQKLMLDRAQISTIHAFCLSVVRRFFYKAGLDPRFRVLDENEAQLLRQDALSDLFEELYADEGDKGEAFRALVDRYGGRGVDEGLQETLLRLHDFARTQASMDNWLDEAAEMSCLSVVSECGVSPQAGDMETEIWRTPWMRYIISKARKDLIRAHAYAQEALKICYSPLGPMGYATAISDDVVFYVEVFKMLEDPKRFEDIARAVSRLSEFKHKRLGRVAKECDPEKKEMAKDLRDTAKGLLGRVMEYAFIRPAEDLARELRDTAPFVDVLVRLIRELDARYTRRKMDRTGVDFSDLERYCLAVLEQDGCQVATQVRDEFDYVLIDEYQDTNPLQERILSLVASQCLPGNRFMVGDLKQSIYRFRLAEPRIFLEKFGTYRKVDTTQAPVALLQAEQSSGLDTSSQPNAAAQVADSSAHSRGVRIDLTHNFRSRAEVIDSVNYLFNDFMRRDVADIEYREDHGLTLGAEYPVSSDGTYRAELHLVERQDQGAKGEGGNEVQDQYGGSESGAAGSDATRVSGSSSSPNQSTGLEEFEALEKEALVVADRIQDMVNPASPLMLWDARLKTQRPCSYKDIAILMRSTKDRANAVLEILSRCDIPAYADSGTGYFQAREIEVALSLLSVIDNPMQDIPLAAVLRSPIVGLSATDLARIRAAHKKGEFYEAVKAYADNYSLRDITAATAMPATATPTATMSAAGNLQAPASDNTDSSSLMDQLRISNALAKFFIELDRWRTLARRRPLAEVLWTILRDTGYQDYVGGLPGGAQRQANLRALCDRAREFDSFGRHGLFRFLKFIEKIQDSKGDLGTARALGEQEDVVRVMSIHKAKGLEFPVVFVIDMGKQFNLEDTRQDILYHRDLGIGPVYCDLDSRVKYPTGLHQAISMRIKDENLAEEMRVLYVALTRAKEKLVMVGSARDLARNAAKWGRIDPSSAQTYLDWICPALQRQAVPPVDITFWGTLGGRDIPAPEPKALGEHDLAWKDVRELKPPAPSDSKIRSEIEKRLTWEYGYPALTGIFAKMSVGEIRRRLEGEDEESWRDDYVSVSAPSSKLPDANDLISHPPGRTNDQAARSSGTGEAADAESAYDVNRREGEVPAPLKGAARGVAVHAMIARMSLDKSGSYEDVRDEAIRLLDLGLIESPGLDNRDLRAVAEFFTTPAGTALRETAAIVRRELPFTMRVPASIIAGQETYRRLAAGDETGDDVSPASRAISASGSASNDPADSVIVQGVIDVLVDEDDGLTVLDFKTDDIPEDVLQARFQSYLPQIALYALAAERILKKPVKRASLVFLTVGKTIDANWQEYLRSAGIA